MLGFVGYSRVGFGQTYQIRVSAGVGFGRLGFVDMDRQALMLGFVR